MKGKNKILISILLCVLVLFTSVGVALASTVNSFASTNNSIKIHYKSTKWKNPNIYYWNSLPENIEVSWPGKQMTAEDNDWYVYEFKNKDKINFLFNKDGEQTDDLTRNAGEWWYKDGKWYDYNPETVDNKRTDFRDETIYFVIPTRFYDGDPSNNKHCWDDAKAGNGDNDPAWRGDFKGLIQKLDYIKALGFSAIWITPPVKNMSYYDYHGYHAINFNEIDPRYLSDQVDYQDLINACHEKGIKIIQDIVLNHTSNNGEENLMPLVTKTDYNNDIPENAKRMSNSILPTNYDSLSAGLKHDERYKAMKKTDPENIYHHQDGIDYEGFTATTGQFADDCVDLNTENPKVYNYLIDVYNKYIDMGVDAFRIDTVKHISRLTFNKTFIPAFKQRGGENFYMFGECAARVHEVWNKGVPPVSSQFYTWKESKSYPWSDTDPTSNCASTEMQYKDNTDPNTQPISNNAFLNGNDYHTPDYSMKSGLDMIDFTMHWNFDNASNAFNAAKNEDKFYNDSTWNVTYVDSHDYGPNSDNRYNEGTEAWAENLNLMFTFRGIPCLYYGSEIEFKKGVKIDYGSTAPLENTGRAYFGDNIEGSVTVTDYAKYSNATGTMASTLSSPLAKHIQRLNLIRRAVPALRKGQYSTEGVSGNMAFKRRYVNKEDNIDSFVCVAITNAATFTGIPSGTYVDAVTGDTKQVNGTLSIPASGKGNMRVYVLQNSSTTTGKIGEAGTYLK
ncbi:MAG: starch-binding protein [Clostridiales bacterium]|nr:starch-binding protein [Clostridiales bacterium]